LVNDKDLQNVVFGCAADSFQVFFISRIYFLVCFVSILTFSLLLLTNYFQFLHFCVIFRQHASVIEVPDLAGIIAVAGILSVAQALYR
jgi:hypothetical protein